jgi:hypothetical protein
MPASAAVIVATAKILFVFIAHTPHNGLTRQLSNLRLKFCDQLVGRQERVREGRPLDGAQGSATQ